MAERIRGGPTVREGNEILYDCTFGCNQSFPTFDAWKDHEVADHMQEAEQHIYVCHELEDGPKIVNYCGLTFRGVKAFEVHIAKTHKMIRYELDQFSISAAHGHRYWCGFCNATKTLGLGKAVERPFWWNSRAGHIQVHYTVEKRIAAYGGWKLPGEDANRRKERSDMIEWAKADASGSGSAGDA